MKRYILFMCSYYYPRGGADDMELMFDTLGELSDHLHSAKSFRGDGFFNILDIQEGEYLGEDWDFDNDIEYMGNVKIANKIVNAFMEWRC